MEKEVTIVVPVYKTEKYLRRCVESILRQDFEDFEVILVDDGSPDNSGALCDKLAQEDCRILTIHKANGGLSSARNVGIEKATGKFVCFVDSDDYIAPDYLSSMLFIIQKHAADLVKIDYVEISTDDYSAERKEVSEQVFVGTEIEKAYLELRVDSACVFLYRRELIGTSRFPEGKTSEDIPFNFELFQKANKFVYLPAVKYYYYHNEQSISNGPLDKNMMNYLMFRKDIYQHYCGGNEKELERLSEVLYARAAMGLNARMALYGISKGMNEREYRKEFKKVFRSHSSAFYHDKGTAFSRKVLAFFVFNCYPLVRVVGRIVN